MHIEPWVAPSGRRRLLVQLELEHAARYARAAELAFPPGPRAPRSYGSARRADRTPDLGRELRAWGRAIRGEVAWATVIERGDVQGCFASIRPAVLERTSEALGGDPAQLLATLRPVWDRGIVGLPIGPTASSYLADRLLSFADTAAGLAGAPPFRWVDDVVFLGDAEIVTRSARAWRTTITDLGLRPHDGKAHMAHVRDCDGLLATSHANVGVRGIIRLP
jgi:hypothetical protein